ncbi:MAG: hypothetical protein LBQ09_02015 [Acidobacteriaceae bacterium]|nr:hypothetical protein [Acidobacteriaceae bacterium]
MFFSAALFAQNAPQQQRKLSDAEKKEVQTIVKVVDDAAAGQAMANDLSLAWLREDLLKAQGNKQYLPFSVSLDPSKVTTGRVSLYWRVVSKDAPAPAPAAAAAADKKDDKKAPAKKDFPYEDLNIIQIPSGQSGPMNISRSFTVAPGKYDVYVVAKEVAPDKAPKNAPAPKVSIIKHSIDVPDLWNGELNTSSVIIAERIDPLPAPLTAAQQAERPYALGTMEIQPAFTNKFTKKSELSTFLLIYNAKTDSGNKPDVTVEYNFYTTQNGAEKFFNKTNPQNLNAQTLPPQFDFAAGHQLQSGQAVPLASFPAGDYRLEIKVTDKLADKTLTRNVEFSISE